MHPQPRMQDKKAYERSHHRFTGIIRHSPRNSVTAYNVISPVIGLCCHRRLRNYFRRLDASVEASEPHDFAVRVRTFRQACYSVHRIPPRVPDDRDRPSMGRDGAGYGFDLGKTRRNIFLQIEMDSGNCRFARQANRARSSAARSSLTCRPHVLVSITT